MRAKKRSLAEFRQWLRDGAPSPEPNSTPEELDLLTEMTTAATEAVQAKADSAFVVGSAVKGLHADMVIIDDPLGDHPAPKDLKKAMEEILKKGKVGTSTGEDLKELGRLVGVESVVVLPAESVGRMDVVDTPGAMVVPDGIKVVVSKALPEGDAYLVGSEGICKLKG